MTKHIHCDLIKAWADGATIQVLDNEEWRDCRENMPSWIKYKRYRIKPEKKKCCCCCKCKE